MKFCTYFNSIKTCSLHEGQIIVQLRGAFTVFKQFLQATNQYFGYLGMRCTRSHTQAVFFFDSIEGI